MDCEFSYDDIIKKSNSKSVLKTIIKSRKNSRLKYQDEDPKDHNNQVLISPSEYIKEISVKPEKLVRSSIDSKKYRSSVFTPNPKIVIFQKFNVNDVYTCTLNVQNTSKVPHQLKLVLSDSVPFNVIFKGSTLNTRLAPGMIHTYEVQFLPDEYCDYSHEIEFKTDLGSFLVPVIAIGPRPLLSFPDQIDVGTTGLKVPKVIPISLQNIGEEFTGFSISCDNPRFEITPEKGSLHQCALIQIRVTFTPTKVGYSSGKINLRYESGDTVQSLVFGQAVECKVRIKEPEVRMENTFLDLGRTSIVEIVNDSEFLLKYEWVKFKTKQEDQDVKERNKLKIDLTDELSNHRMLPDVEELLLSRMYSDKCDVIESEDFQYSNEHFEIMPMKGEVWPNKSAMLTVNFQPKSVGDIATVAYLEIQGIEDRLSLSLFGKCLGPCLELNVISLDIGEIYLCGTYNYELVCKNSGPIPGTLAFLPKSSEFGNKISIDPPETKIEVARLETMKLSFYSNCNGSFVERIDFMIKESSEILSIVIKGNVICPIARIDTEEMDFGSASIVTKQLSFRNLSHAPVEYSVTVPSDGHEQAITSKIYARVFKKPGYPLLPLEFQMTPSHGTLKPDRCLRLEVSYTPNTPRIYETIPLHVNICKSANADPVVVLMKSNAKAADFIIEPDEINIRFCFINYPYCRKIRVKNISEVEGFYYIVHQEVTESTSVLYTLSNYQNYLRPGEMEELQLTILVKEEHKQKFQLSMLNLGMRIPMVLCEVSCTGKGPVISTEPSKLDWGEVSLLQKITKTFELINDSPIPAKFEITIGDNKSEFEVDLTSGELEPHESTPIDVSIFLRDTGKYSAFVHISLPNGDTTSVRLTAIGVGTCIIFEPEIFPTYDLGVIFSRQNLNYPIKVRNEGNKHYSLFLTISEKAFGFKRRDVVETTFFKVEPCQLDLPPGAQKTIDCKVRSNEEEVVSEQWYAFASVLSKDTKHEFLGMSTITASFTNPHILFDKDTLYFRIDLGVDYEFFDQEKEVIITNQTNRDMYAHFSIDSPFAFISDCSCNTDYREINLINDEPVTVKIAFLYDLNNSEKVPRNYCGYVNIYYDNHKRVDKILLLAEVNFPHLVFDPEQIDLYCATNKCVEKIVKVTNDSPLLVFFNIEWIKDSFKYERLEPLSEGGSEEMHYGTDSSLIKSSHESTSKKSDEKFRFCGDSFTDNFSFLSPNMEHCEDAISFAPKENDLIDRFLRIEPRCGAIESQHETEFIFTFNGYESVKIFVQAKVEIKGGKTAILNINAIADDVRCTVLDFEIDYGLQSYCESATRTLKVMNLCRIPLDWHIEMTTDVLKIIDETKTLEPLSDVVVTILRRASPPGYYSEKIYLEIIYLEPFIIGVKWISTIPQVCLEVSRKDNAFEKYPVEFGYKSVQLLQAELPYQSKNFVNFQCSSVENSLEHRTSGGEEKIIEEEPEFTEFEFTWLIDKNWDIITEDEIIPSVLDFNMAFERYIVKDFMLNDPIISSSTFNGKSYCLPPLMAPDYIVDLGHVTMDENVQLTIDLENYGYEKAKVQMKKEISKWKTPKSCFQIEFAKNLESCQCERSSLNIQFNPKREIFSHRENEVSYKLQFEVKRGVVIPVTVKATAVYPYLTTSGHTLNFEEVYIGECREMSLRLKNEGMVDSQWQIDIEKVMKNKKKKVPSPFYVLHDSDIFAPGEFAVVKVYFKPFKNGYQKRDLKITITHGQQTVNIKLIGYGIKQKVKINKSFIKFRPTIPKVQLVEDDIIIENTSSCVLELYWHHLINYSESNRILRVLKHYYQTENILVPRRKIGKNIIPEEMSQLYYQLVQQMFADENFQPYFETILQKVSEDETSYNKFLDLRKTIDKTPVDSKSIANLLTSVNPNDLEIILNAYIDKIQADPEFVDTMKDPFDEMYSKMDRLSPSGENITHDKPTTPDKKWIFLFYGAPFTEYQETACRCSKILNLPLLNLDSLFLEAVALGITSGARKLAQLIDFKYKEIIGKVGKVLSTRRGSGDAFPMNSKLPQPEDFAMMDSLSVYELKLELIEVLSEFSESVKAVVKDQNKKAFLPGTNIDMIKDILKERLAQSKFKYGYVLQTLNTVFFKEEIVLLRILLDMSGKDDFHFLVTFHNSYDLYKMRIQNSQRVKDEEDEKRFKVIEAMSEIDMLALPDDDKYFYQEYIARTQHELNLQSSTQESAPTPSITNCDEIINLMNDFKTNLENIYLTISEWEMGKPVFKKVPTSAKEKARPSINPSVKFPEKVFVWYVQAEDPWERYMYDSIVNQFSILFHPFAEKSVSNVELPQVLLPSRTYSVLKEFETQKKLPWHDLFILSLQKEDQIQKSSTSTHRSHKSSENDFYLSSKSSLESVDSETPAVWTLDPGQFNKFKIRFKSWEKGNFMAEFLLGLLNNGDAIFEIKAEGIVDVPRIDMSPEVIFEKVKSSKLNEAHEPCFFVNTQTFDFGCLLILPEGERKHKKQAQFKIRNVSVLPVTVYLSLADDKYDNFSFDPPVLDIDPGASEFLNVTARALELGSISDNLVLTLKNNSKTEIIRLRGQGSEINIEFEPSTVDLGRLLLHTLEKHLLTIRNKSAITIYWHLKNVEPDQRLRSTPSIGQLKFKETCELQIQYYASKVSPSEIKSLLFEVFLNEKYSHPVFCQEINVTAETYEVNYDLQADELIDFGCMPVGSSISKKIILKNHGPFEFNYQMQFNESELLKKLHDVNLLTTFRRDFIITPYEGSVQPKKEVVIELTFIPSFECILQSILLLSLLIIEPYKDIGVTNECALNISVHTFYTRCSIEPFPSLNFGTLALNTVKVMYLLIENVGQFPFKYNIHNVSTLLPKSSSLKKLDDDTISKMTKKSGRQSASAKNIPTKWGPFTIEKISGEVEPGTTDTLTISCSSDKIGNFEEKLYVMVPDTFPNSEESRHILLVVDVCAAVIDFEHFNEIFPESYVVDSINDFNCTKVSSHTVLSKSTMCLYFFRVCVGTKFNACVSLQNTSSVDGEVMIMIFDDTGSFTTSVDRLIIPPMSKQNFEINFSPIELKTFTGRLELSVILPQNSEPQTLIINLEGKSNIPQLSIISPKFEKDENLVVDFGKVLNREVSIKNLKLKNTGQIMAEVTVDINDNLENLFSLYSKMEGAPCGCVEKNIENTYVTFLIAPNEVSDIELRYKPKYIGKSQSNIIVSLENNPYDTYNLSLVGESYMKSVVFENLKLVNPVQTNDIKEVIPEPPKPIGKKKSSRKSADSISLNVPVLKTHNKISLAYDLDYEVCSINKMYRINFRIVNKTSNQYYKFEWPPHQNLVFIPRKGHLGPKNFKEMTATFLASELTILEKTPIECMINEIMLKPPIIEPFWDSRETKVFWREKFPSSAEFELQEFEEDDIFFKKINICADEPDHRVIPETEESIQVLVSVTADYAEFDCDTKSIIFDGTLMFQTREKKLTMKNTSAVNLHYVWKLVMDDQFPSRLNRPFSEESSMTFLGSNSAGRRSSANKEKLEHSISKIDLSRDSVLSNISPRSTTAGYTTFKTARTDVIALKRDQRQEEDSDLFSSSAEQTDRSTDSWIEGENCPFIIIPDEGTIEPYQSVEFIIKFQPVDVFEYKANFQCKIENLSPSQTLPNIFIQGKSYLPYFHFEIEPSDYLTCGKRDNTLPVPANCKIADPKAKEKIRVVEFKVLGTGSCQTSYISMVNPTTDDYTYRWTKFSGEKMVEIPALTCAPLTGVSSKGKRIKFAFSVIPEKIGLYETFWQFEVKRYALKTQFLILFNVVEPSVCVRNPTVKLQPTSIGDTRCSSFDLLNNESCALDFKILSDSLFSEGRFQNVNVYPMAGSLVPNVLQTINVNYVPTLVGVHEFKVKIKIEKLREPITAIILAPVFEILPKIMYIDAEGQKTIIREKYDNIIDIGHVILKEPTKIEIKIINTGEIDFNYEWDFQTSNEEQSFDLKILSQKKDKVITNSHNYTLFELIANAGVMIHNHPITLKIDYGHIYRIKLCATAKNSPLEFSFTSYNFGMSYIQTYSRHIRHVDLLIKNNQKIPCLVKCHFENNASFQVEKDELINPIPKNGTVRVPIHFEPSEERLYEEVLPFSSCNDAVKKDIILSGEGIAYRVKLKNSCDAMIDVGSVPVHRYVNRKIIIVNDGKNPVNLKIILKKISYEDPCKLSKCIVNKIDFGNELTSSENQDFSEFFQISPSTLKKLNPGKEMDVNIKFKAAKRVKMLKATFLMQVDVSTFPLLTFKGRCTTANFYLNRSYISFGTIYQECSAEEKLILVNDGDIGSKFTWVKTNPHFSLKPTSGFCQPKSEIVFTCIFKPSSEFTCLQTEITIKLEEFKDLNFVVSGNCNLLPDPIEDINFMVELRKSETKMIEVFNDTVQVWNLKPLIVGDCFTTPATLRVDPKEKKLCSITYQPQKKTPHQPDKAKLVIAFPNGKPPAVYSLSGTCAKVKLYEKIIRKVPVYKKYVETLAVLNKSDSKKIFHCSIINISNPQMKPGVSQITVPAKKQKPFDFVFNFTKEGVFSYKAIFDDHDENYQTHDIEFQVVGPEIQKVIELVTFVRSSTFYSLKFVNPLETELGETFYASIDDKDVTIHGLPTYLESQKSKSIQIEYFPLLPEVKKIKTLIIGNEAETVKLFYELRLTAESACPEKPTYVIANLGSFTVFSLSIKNCSNQQSEFIMDSDESSVTCTKSVISVAPGDTDTVDVQFYPISLKEIKANVTAISETAGKYVFPIVGNTNLPEPQGPLTVSFGAPTVIKFENIFKEAKEFKITVDNECFNVENTYAIINSKESFIIQVNLEERDVKEIGKAGNKIRTGKLIITCKDETLNGVEWVYYLKGVLGK